MKSSGEGIKTDQEKGRKHLQFFDPSVLTWLLSHSLDSGCPCYRTLLSIRCFYFLHHRTFTGKCGEKILDKYKTLPYWCVHLNTGKLKVLPSNIDWSRNKPIDSNHLIWAWTLSSLSCLPCLRPLSGFLLCSSFTTSTLSVATPLLFFLPYNRKQHREILSLFSHKPSR